ncbi:hypothetical protein ACFSJ3_05355 [Corallincola platygyrae]|uniref:Carbohydrate-binding module family 96 domain-containing protein n=1 Tax=Corallincola platygyrae TaxID=1193278 RepID=A0ABW4XJF3_9GAMM
MSIRKLVAGAALLSLSSIANAGMLTVSAFDTGSMSATNSWNDDRLRAYYNQSTGHVDGFMKFDLSVFADDITIESMTLTTYHEEGFGNPYQDPEVSIYHVNDDSWSRGSSHPGLNEQLTTAQTGFPGGDYIAYDWILDIDAFDWLADLSDDTLSLAMRNEKESYSYVYWHGSDNQMWAPTLTINYTSDVPAPAPLALLALGILGLVTRRTKG